MRCFIALELSDEARKGLSEIQKKLPEAEMKLVEPENLHLTLQFIGELTEEQVEKCMKLLRQVKFQKFKAKLGNLGFFPSEDYLRVLWIALEPSEIVKQLHDKICNALKPILSLDNKFKSHVTMARIKSITDKKGFIEQFKSLRCKEIEFEVESFVLKKSTLTEKGPVYEDLEEFKLT